MSADVQGPGAGPTADAELATSWRGDPAGIASRAVAFTIDAIVISIAVSGTLFATHAVVDVLDPDRTASLSTAESFLSVGFVVGVVSFLYFTVSFWLFGQTVGKLTMGIRVVRADGERPRLGQSALRTFAYTISSILMLGFLAIAVSRQRRAWHDHIARTWVVYDWEAHPRIPVLDDGERLPPHRLP